jgi:hypothetical protein
MLKHLFSAAVVALFSAPTMGPVTTYAAFNRDACSSRPLPSLLKSAKGASIFTNHSPSSAPSR